MQCHNPYIPAGSPDVPAPCRKCIACRVNLKRLWTHRLILESQVHENSTFLTLTYDDNHLHENGAQVSVREMQKFLKRLRKHTGLRGIRFYAVGEYGDRTWRPHYHLAIFGLGCENDGLCQPIKHRAAEKYFRKNPQATELDRSCYEHEICNTCKKIDKAWKKGFVDVGGKINGQNAAYICGYVTKKMTKADDERLNHGENQYLHPEFSTQSPNLGLLGLFKILDEWKDSSYWENALTDMGDIPYSLIHDGKSYPIGRHLRQKARAYLGLEEAYDPLTGEIKYVSKEAEKIIQKENLQVLREDEKVSPDAKVSLKAFMKEQNEQRNKNLEKRFKIFKKEKIL